MAKVYEKIPPQFIGATVMLGTILFITSYLRLSDFRTFFNGLSLSELILCHCIRVPIGGAFLFFASEGMLPELFARNAGYGDILTGCLGFSLVILVQYFKRIKKLAFGVWSLVGVIDLFTAVGTGLYMATTAPASMDWITRLPLILVPVIILPFLFGTHFLIIYRLIKE